MTSCVLLAVALTPLVDWLSFSEGRWAGEPKPLSFKEWSQWMAAMPPRIPDANPDYEATAKGMVFGLFPDRLFLPSETIVGEQKLEETKKEIASSGRGFVPTIDLSDRDLQAAELAGSDLRGVSLNGTRMEGADLSYSRLDGATFISTTLRAATLEQASLRGAALDGAYLQGANLAYANLKGATLNCLYGNNLSVPTRCAELQGANLASAELQGASLTHAQLQGASLGKANLQGADLQDAQLQSASLRSAQLQGADLVWTQLQGADLSYADLRDSALLYTFVFGADISHTNLSTTAIGAVHTRKIKSGFRLTSALTPANVEMWMESATKFAPDKDKLPIANRFNRLRAMVTGMEETNVKDVSWAGMQDAVLALDPGGAKYRRRLADRLGELACKPDHAPDVARGLIFSNDLLEGLGDEYAIFRARFDEGRKDSQACPSAAGLSEFDWRAFDLIKPH
jgi:uncharacterized protein YjbI with pentapeptide repeats